MKILFLHGKESTPETSHTAQAIKEYFKDLDVLIPDYQPSCSDFEEIADFLVDYYNENVGDDACVVIGISLGGFWALKLTDYVPCYSVIALNPAVRYYGAGTYPEPNADVAGHIILNMDDEIIDSNLTANLYNKRFLISTFPKGGHRMKNMDNVLPLIESSIEHFDFFIP